MPKTVDLLTLTDPKKHSIRYDCPGEASGVGTIYVLKGGLGQARPNLIRVTVEWDFEEDENPNG